MGVRKKTQSFNNLCRLRRLAIQIAAQLPEDNADALVVLEYARELVVSFLSVKEEPEPAPEGNVRPLR